MGTLALAVVEVEEEEEEEGKGASPPGRGVLLMWRSGSGEEKPFRGEVLAATGGGIVEGLHLRLPPL